MRLSIRLLGYELVSFGYDEPGDGLDTLGDQTRVVTLAHQEDGPYEDQDGVVFGFTRETP